MPNDDDITVFARTTFRNQHQKFGIKTPDRRQHMYVLGKTGTGKSTLLENLIVADIRAGRGCAVLDPHGDLLKRVLDLVPSYRINDVILFDPADLDYPIGFNVLANVAKPQRPLVASAVLGVFHKLFVDSWGPRTEHLLRGTLLTLLEVPQSTLLDIPRFLTDSGFRDGVVKKLNDPELRALWAQEFPAYGKRLQGEAVAPILNKVGALLLNPILRGILGQKRMAFDMREAMDSGKILLVNLAKGQIGEDVSMLLGALMVARIQTAAMARLDVPEHARPNFYLYLDEFQSYVTPSFAELLAEARKTRLNIVLSHQFLAQLPDVVSASILGNVGTIVSFRLGSVDAELMAQEFYPVFKKEHFLQLPRYHVYLRLMIDGVMSDPFSAMTLAPTGEVEGHAEKIMRISRERYGSKKTQR